MTTDGPDEAEWLSAPAAVPLNGTEPLRGVDGARLLAVRHVRPVDE